LFRARIGLSDCRRIAVDSRHFPTGTAGEFFGDDSPTGAQLDNVPASRDGGTPEHPRPGITEPRGLTGQQFAAGQGSVGAGGGW
jgi:hypothetical protein